MDQCKDCKHWNTADPTPGGYCRCEQPTENPYKSTAARSSISYTDEGFWYGFMTGPDFGCVNFTPKGE